MGTALSDLRSKIRRQAAMEDERFISNTELNEKINEAIREAENIIHDTYEKYFLSEANLSITAGTQLVDYPSDIYLNKVLKIIYDSYNDGTGTNRYLVNRIRRLEDIPFIDDQDDYSWLPVNDGTNGRKIKIYPSPRDTTSTTFTIYYIRNAAALSADDDECDIDEFEDYVTQHAIVSCLAKDGLSPLQPKAEKRLEDLRIAMVESLKNMVPDEDNTVIPDISFYEDYDVGYPE